MTIAEIVKGNNAEFTYYRNGKLCYKVVKQTGEPICLFHIDIEENAGATFEAKHKAISLMRWIRICMENGELIYIRGE